MSGIMVAAEANFLPSCYLTAAPMLRCTVQRPRDGYNVNLAIKMSHCGVNNLQVRPTVYVTCKLLERL